MRTPVGRSPLTALLVAALLAGAPALAQQSVHFEAGSLIIPEDATFQSPCGSTSAYGLVYHLLRENQAGGIFGPTNPVTIYWVISQTKNSPNRCTPTNKHATPSSNPHAVANIDSIWLDGCDMSIPSGGEAIISPTTMPVVNVDYAVTLPRTVSGTTTILYDPAAANSAITTFATASPNPVYASVTLDNNGVACPTTGPCSSRFVKARYMGGPFIISANDTQRVIAAIQDANNIYLHSYMDTTCTCTSFSSSYSSCHYVNMHQATVSFDAVVYKQINRTPPPLAILQSGPGVIGDMLPKYLSSANLNFSGAGGCPPNSTVCTLAQGKVYDTIQFPEDLKTITGFPHGIINQLNSSSKPYYRTFWMPHWTINDACDTGGGGNGCSDMANKVAGACNSDHGGAQECGDRVCQGENNTNPNVKDLAQAACNAGSNWALASVDILAAISASPSRCTSSTAAAMARMQAQYSATGSTCTNPTTEEVAQTLENINYFSDQSGSGIFAECAAIGTLEATPSSVYHSNIPSGPVPLYYRNAGTAASTSALNTSSITSPVTPRFMYTNYVGVNGASTSGTQANCTDPDITSTYGYCLTYPNPGNPFSQIANFIFTPHSGAITSWEPLVSSTPTPASSMRSGVVRLAASWKNWTAQSSSLPAEVFTPTVPGSYQTTASGGTLNDSKNNWDVFTMYQKNNDPNKATILYLGGHTYDGDVAGTRVVLNTLLNLGSDPVSSDRSVTAPVAFSDANGSDASGTKALLLSSTFQALTGNIPANTDTFVASVGSRFKFPYVSGDLRAHSIIGGTALVAGEGNDLADAVLWSANAQLPAPGARNIFSYVGGKVTANPTLPNSGVAAHNVMQVGWQPLSFDQSEIVAPVTGTPAYNLPKNTNCTDVLTYQSITEGGTTGLGLTPDSTGDGICDLQQLLHFSTLNPDTSWHIQTADITQLTTDVPTTKQIVSMARGFCYATVGKVDGIGTPVYEPTLLSQCNGSNPSNVAEFGGLVNSTAAVVPPSAHIPGASSHERPTVAYVGGYDGMLHAIYVSGGAGYTGPMTALRFPAANDASSTFKTALAPQFATGGTLPNAGTELWAFMPSSQMPFLRTNGARVDSSPVVQDVFVDLGGTGKREWHTVLLMSVGESSRELLAMDITDPLKPVLLWDLVGSTYRATGYPEIASTSGFANDSTGGTGYSYKWNGTYRNNSNDTSYILPPASDPGRTASGLYDYSALGATRNISVGQVRAGLAPLYAAYVASNSSSVIGNPGKAIEVFAIDIATGQKLWQWEREFLASDTSRTHDNAVPRAPTLAFGRDGVVTLYVGDFDGRVWELDAVTGVNRNFMGVGTGCTGDCGLSAFDTDSNSLTAQAITTNISVAKIPPAPSGDFTNYAGETVLLFGTGGTSMLPATSGGRIYSVLTSSQFRKPVLSGGFQLDGTTPWTATAAMTDAQAGGICQTPANWPKALTAPERVYGVVTVAGRTAFVPVVNGAVNLSDILHSPPSAKLYGKTVSFDLGSTTGALGNLANFTFANFGGVAVYHQDLGGGASTDIALTTEVSRIATYSVTNNSGSTAMTPDATLAVGGTSNGLTYRLLNWFKRHLGD